MAHEEFEIEIDANGKVTVRTVGIKGARCLEFARLFVEIIGREESRQFTSEYYEPEVEVRQQSHIDQRRS